MDFITPENLLLIFSFCDPRTLLRLRTCCRQFSSIASCAAIWKPLTLKLLPESPSSDPFGPVGDLSPFFKTYFEVVKTRNLVTNGFFENDESGWSVTGTSHNSLQAGIGEWRMKEGRETMDFHRTTEDSFLGRACMAGRGGAVTPFSKRITQSFRVYKDQVVLMSAWVRSAAVPSCLVFMQFNGRDYKWHSSPKARYTSRSNEWQLLQCRFGPLSCDTFCFVFLWNAHESEYAYFDHVFVAVTETEASIRAKERERERAAAERERAENRRMVAPARRRPAPNAAAAAPQPQSIPPPPPQPAQPQGEGDQELVPHEEQEEEEPEKRRCELM